MDAAWIVAALSAGVAAGSQEVATTAVTDAYARLKAVLGEKFAGSAAARTALAQHEEAPDAWGPALESELTRIDAPSDTAITDATDALYTALEAIRPGGGDVYVTDARYGRGIAIGRGNTVNNAVEQRRGRRPRGTE